MIPQKQLTLADIFEDCQEFYESDKPHFLTLLENHIDLDEIVPISFRRHYYASTGRNRKYPLNAMLWALIIQRLFSIPTDSLLLIFLHYSRHLREFCGFTKVPDASKITRFKQDFLDDLQSVFDNLVDVTEPICRDIDNNLASMLLFDTSGIEAYVTENNPKYANRIIKQLKSYATMKFVCPKMKWEYNRTVKSKRRVCHCDNPCTTSSCGRMIYVYPEKNLRAYPGVERGSREWDDTYKIRVNVEKSINHFKGSFCVANRKTTNEKTLHADLLLAGISQLLTVAVADKINQRQHIRSLKSFIA